MSNNIFRSIIWLFVANTGIVLVALSSRGHSYSMIFVAIVSYLGLALFIEKYRKV